MAPWSNEAFVPSAHDVERLTQILGGEGDWYSAHLFRLIAKADQQNRALLAYVYPLHVEAYEAWHRGERRPENDGWKERIR